MIIPKVYSLWKHKEKLTLYKVIAVSNQKTQRPEEFPITVFYVDINTNDLWSRPLEKWLERVELVSEAECFI